MPRRQLRLEAAYEDAQRQVFLLTRDVSPTGVFLLSRDLPAPDAAAHVALALPGDGAIVRLRGRVVRCAAPDEAPGFAIRFDPEGSRTGDRSALRRFLEGAGEVLLSPKR